MCDENIVQQKKTFIVRQSLFFNYFLGIIFLAIFIGVIFTIKGQSEFTGADYIKFSALLLIPSIGLFIHGSCREIVLKFDTTGIYFGNSLVTSWSRLLRAYTTEVGEDKEYDIRFSLYVEYYPENSDAPCIVKFPLSSTIDKSIEEISTAIIEFSQFVG